MQSVTVYYNKVWQTLLQSVSGVKECDSNYKVICNNKYEKFREAYLFEKFSLQETF